MEVKNIHSFLKLRKFSRKLKYPEEKVKFVFQKEVLENEDFKRHIEETAKKLEYSPEIVKAVVSHYFLSNLLKLKTKTQRLRIVIYKFFYLEHINPLNNELSAYHRQYKADQKYYKQKKLFKQNGKLH